MVAFPQLVGGRDGVRYPLVGFTWDLGDNTQVRAQLPRLDRLLN